VVPRGTSQTDRRRRPPRAEPETPPNFGWRLTSVGLRILVPLAILVGLAGGVFYVRLLNGPISLKLLAQPIAQSLSAELGDHSIEIDDAIARLTPAGDVEFRLRDVRLLNADRKPVAAAPLAAFSMSGEALWSGRLTPERIILIEPRVTLTVAPPGEPARPPTLRVDAQPPAGAPTSPQTGQSSGGSSEAADNLTGFDVIGAVTRTASVPSRNNAASFLKQLGFRQATFVVEGGPRPTTYRGLDADLDLESWRRTGIAIARLSAVSPRGRWTMEGQFAQKPDGSGLAVTGKVENFFPAAVVGVDHSRMLSGIAAPLSGTLAADIGREGALTRASATIDIGQGQFLIDASHGIPLQQGRLALAYRPADNRVDIEPSILTLDGKRIEFIGAAAAETADRSAPWRFSLRTQQGIAAGPNGRLVPIDQFDVDGRVDMVDGALDITRAQVKSNGSEAIFTARFPGHDREPYRIEGRSSGMSLDSLKTLWPQGVASEARNWVSNSLTQGRVASATLRVEGQPPRSGRIGQRTWLTLDAAEVGLALGNGWPQIDIPRGLVRIEDNALDVTIPEATTGPTNRKLALRQGRVTVPNLAADFPQGEVTLRPQGPLGALLALLDGEQRTLSRQMQTSFDGVEGRFEGQVKVSFPLEAQPAFRDIHLEGKGRITEGRGRGLIGGLDVQGATLAVDLNDEALEVQGDMLLQGVAAKLSAQHLLRIPSNEAQPPIRITARLDASDRNQLGLDINHMVAGEVPVEIVAVRTGAEVQPRVQANLTAAELTLESLGWRKASGRPATLNFDIVRGQRYRTELQNFRIQGEDIAINGWLGLDQQNKVREVVFSDFVLNVVSRLEVQGTLRPDNVWDMRVKGATFDGRDFFRTLLQVGRAVEPAPGSKGANRPGMDLRAEIETLLGHGDIALRGVRMQLSRRNDKLVSLQARGTLDGGKPLDVTVQPGPATDPRRMIALSDDAGRVFKFVGFYPNAEGGRMRLTINLDGKGPVEKTGLLEVASFRILGDPVVYEVIASAGDGQQGRRETRTVRQAIDFERMRAPFSIGQGQFVLEDADLRGPLLGATLKGKVDFRAQTLQLGGTYIPLQGLNSALGAIPGIGQILAGPRGEGVLGMTFAIQGPMAQPQVIVNPLSLVAPGIFREMFQMTNPTPRVTPRSDAPAGRPSQSASPSTAQQGRPQGTVSGVEGWRSESTPSQ